MPSHRSTRDYSVIPAVELRGAAFVLDPELEVRDGTYSQDDKEIPVDLYKTLFGCKAKLVNADDEKALAYNKSLVKWRVRNTTKQARTVAIIFIDANGAPLKGCLTQAPVPPEASVVISCEVQGVHRQHYEYVIWCK